MPTHLPRLVESNSTIHLEALTNIHAGHRHRFSPDAAGMGSSKLPLRNLRCGAALDMEERELRLHLRPGSLLYGARLSNVNRPDISVCYSFQTISPWYNFLRPRCSVPSLSQTKCQDPKKSLIPYHTRHLKPGGWVEFQSITAILQCDDGSLRPGSPLSEFSDRLEATCQAYRTSRDDPLRWEAWFAARGFVGTTEHVFRVPCNPWPRDDARQKLVGAFEMDNLLRHLRGISMRPFRRAFGWPADEVEAFLGRVKDEIGDSSVHAYWPL